ncbi:MAG: hypothetical protein J6S45_05030, partial [Firmicutes bacterium]|nr:hypothetical protein [Bacillota bacterium]
MKRWICVQTWIICSLLLGLLTACGSPEELPVVNDVGFEDEYVIENVIIEDEAVALAEAPAAIPDVIAAVMKDVEASGTLVKSNDKAIIDYSNTKDGYVMVKYTAETVQKLKAQVRGPLVTYTYNVTPGQWEVLPLSDGNGEYKISLFENVSGTKYAGVLSQTTRVEMTDAFAP